MPDRLSYEESCQVLQEYGLLEDADIPPIPVTMPSYDDDEPFGVSFFKMGVEDIELENLTLPRTFFGRSLMREVSFCNTDLIESRMCWDDFIDVNFSLANLTGCDMRASRFERVSFARSDLSYSDLRRSEFTDCDFTEARMHQAKLTRPQGQLLSLSALQCQEVDWQEEEGEEPGGG